MRREIRRATPGASQCYPKSVSGLGSQEGTAFPHWQKGTADLSLSDSDGLRSRYLFAKGVYESTVSAVGRRGRSASAAVGSAVGAARPRALDGV